MDFRLEAQIWHICSSHARHGRPMSPSFDSMAAVPDTLSLDASVLLEGSLTPEACMSCSIEPACAD